MRTGTVFVTAMAAALTFSVARAENWLSLFKISDDRPTEIFIDLSSITLKDNIRSAQTKKVALLPWRDNTQPFNGAAYGIQRVSFDCNAGLVQVGGPELHSVDGRIVAFLNVEQSWQPVDDPVTEKMFDLVCGFKDPRVEQTPDSSLPDTSRDTIDFHPQTKSMLESAARIS
jgi:hypothetical protein